MRKTIKFFIIIILLFPIFFFFPNLIQAATLPYLITNPYPTRNASYQETYFTTNFKVNYQAGQILLGANSDGTGPTAVDDAIEISVIKPNGTVGKFVQGYYNGCQYISPKPPADVTFLFAPGENQVSVKLYDVCGGFVGSSSLYLTNLGAPDAKTPVVFIPGIAGSELKLNSATNWNQPTGHGGYYSHYYPAGDLVWLNWQVAGLSKDDDYFDVLRIMPDGTTSMANLSLTGNLVSLAYQPTIDFFTSNGYTKDKDFFVFPYDWRKDISLTTPLLDSKIEEIKTKTGSQKVDLVAHSMGGLVARNYISDQGRASKVRKLINLGAPHLGSVEYLKALIYGKCLKYDIQNYCLSVNPLEVKDVLRNMISGFELAPAKKYFDFYSGSDPSHPLPFRDDRDIDNNGIIGPLNYSQIKTMLTNLKYNTPLFTPSENLHNMDNNYPNTNGVEVSIIAGTGQPTLIQIVESYHTNLLGIKTTYKDIYTTNGDDTVPEYSASLADPSKNLFLNGSARIYYTPQKHGDLVNDGPAMQKVKNILNNQVSASELSQPYHFTGNLLSVHSPVNIHVYDKDNNHTGPLPNGDFEANIPGSSYDTLDDAKFVWLPNDGQYTIKFTSTGNGSFDFKIRNYNNDINTQTVLYKNIPLSISTKAEAIYNTTSTQTPVVNVDKDGNGTTDLQVSDPAVTSGNTVFDQTPPKTTISVANLSEITNWDTDPVVVQLTATDEPGGSGVYRTEYSIDNGLTVQIYNGPFTTTGKGLVLIKARSIDKAGNEEAPVSSTYTMDKLFPGIK